MSSFYSKTAAGDRVKWRTFGEEMAKEAAETTWLQSYQPNGLSGKLDAGAEEGHPEGESIAVAAFYATLLKIASAKLRR